MHEKSKLSVRFPMKPLTCHSNSNSNNLHMSIFLFHRTLYLMCLSVSDDCQIASFLRRTPTYRCSSGHTQTYSVTICPVSLIVNGHCYMLKYCSCYRRLNNSPCHNAFHRGQHHVRFTKTHNHKCLICAYVQTV